jgi:hypothetical protein
MSSSLVSQKISFAICFNCSKFALSHLCEAIFLHKFKILDTSLQTFFRTWRDSSCKEKNGENKFWHSICYFLSEVSIVSKVKNRINLISRNFKTPNYTVYSVSGGDLQYADIPVFYKILRNDKQDHRQADAGLGCHCACLDIGISSGGNHRKITTSYHMVDRFRKTLKITNRKSFYQK